MFHLIVLNFVKNLTWKGWLMIAAVAVIVVILSTVAVNKIVDHFSDNKQVQVNNEDRELRNELSDMRLDSETKISTEERKTNEVLGKLPDAVPSPRRVTRACRELRDGGHVPLPSECGPSAN